MARSALTAGGAIRQGPTDDGIEHFGCLDVIFAKMPQAVFAGVDETGEMILRFEVVGLLHVTVQNVVRPFRTARHAKFIQHEQRDAGQEPTKNRARTTATGSRRPRAWR